MESCSNVMSWMARLKARKAVKRGMRVSGFQENAVAESHSKADFAPEDYDLRSSLSRLGTCFYLALAFAALCFTLPERFQWVHPIHLI